MNIKNEKKLTVTKAMASSLLPSSVTKDFPSCRKWLLTHAIMVLRPLSTRLKSLYILARSTIISKLLFIKKYTNYSQLTINLLIF